MKTFVSGIAAAAVIALASLTAPASAMTVSQTKAVQVDRTAPLTEFSSQHRHRAHRTTIIRRGPVCSMRTVVKRGPYGRRVVTKTRVCR